MRIGDLRILLMVPGTSRFDAPSLLMDVSDDDADDDDDGLTAPLRLPALVIRNISVNK